MSRRSATTVKVFVGSLPPGTTAEELRELFSPYGEIAECDVVNRCGFLHLEDKTLAFKAIDELNNTTFKGTRISVEKGRVKPPNRDRGGPMGRGGPRNGFGGPMRGGRDNFRGSPYMRDGGDFDRPPRGGPPRGGGFGGFDRGFGGRPGPMNPRPMNDGYSNGGDRRPPYMDDRSGGFGNGGFGDSGFGMNSGSGDGMYNDYNMCSNGGRGGGGGSLFERRPMMDDRKPPMDDRPMMGDRRPPPPMMGDRRPLLENQGGPGMGPAPVPPPNMGYDRRPQGDMFSRREPPQKPMGGGYGEPGRNPPYETQYPPIQNRGFSGGPGPRRDMPPVRRF